MKFNHEMLTLAKESRGYSQTHLADILRMSQPNLSKIELGVLQPSSETVQELASVLEYPDSFFYQHEPVYGYGSVCMYHRKRQIMPASEYKVLLARLNILRIRVGRLLKNIEIETQNLFDRIDVKDIGSPQFIASVLRGKWHLPKGPIKNLTETIEAGGGIVVRCAFGTKKVDAFSQWPPGMPPLFFVNTEIPPDRARFSLAHEMGHIVMHRVPTNNMEREANQFAAEFLMPKKEIAPQLRPFSLERLAQLKLYWKVSMSSLMFRARELKKTSESQYRRMVTQFSKLGYRVNEPVQIEHEEPGVIKEIIRIHQELHGLTMADLCVLTSSDEHEFSWSFLPERRIFKVIS